MNSIAVRGLDERRLLLASLGLGLAHHYLFYSKIWGISFPLFVAAFYLTVYSFSGNVQSARKEPGTLLLLPIGLLSLTYALYTNMLFLVLNAIAIPLLVVLQTTWSRPAREKDPLPLRVLEQLFVQTLLYVPRPAALAWKSLSKGKGSGRTKTAIKILLGLLISLPLLLAVVFLLASADTMFDRSISMLPNVLGDWNAGLTIFRILWILFITIAVFAYIAGLLQPKSWSYPVKPEGHMRPNPASAGEGAADHANPLPVHHACAGRLGFDPTIASTVLLMLNAVYLLFAFVQFSYFFGGGAAELPDGITYASYARKGFAELVVVTMINLTVLLTFVYGVRRSTAGVWLFLRILLAVLVGCTGVMLCSAYIRLSMYEEAYGYTVTRLLVHAFMVFLLVLFVLTLAKLWRESLPLMRGYMAAAVAAYVMINYMGIDGMIARNNIARYEASGVIDTAYLGGLSYEAVPYLLELQKQHPELPGVQAALQGFKHRLDNGGREPSWAEFNVSRWRAEGLLKEMR